VSRTMLAPVTRLRANFWQPFFLQAYVYIGTWIRNMLIHMRGERKVRLIYVPVVVKNVRKVYLLIFENKQVT
jgi:hypothetical protein